MILDVILSRVIDWFFALIPDWVARRFINPVKVAEEILIDLRSANPIDISFGSEIPSITIWFRVSNMGPLDLKLDRLLVDLWIGQPMLEATVLHMASFPKRKEGSIHLRVPLSIPQQDQIRRNVEDNIITTRIGINIDAYFHSKAGLIHCSENIERYDVMCKLPKKFG